MLASRLDSRERSPQSPERLVTGRTARDGAAGDARIIRLRRGVTTIFACVGKGGGGKTTTMVNLAVIAGREGWKVGVIDADPQGSTAEWRRARANNDIPVRCCRPDRSGETVDIARRAGIECLFIDMPPDPTLALAAIRAADFVLIPTRPTFFDLKVTLPYIDLLRSVDRRHGIIINAAPPMRQGADAPMVRDARQAFAEITKRMWRGQITHRHAVPHSVTAGRSVIETEPDGAAAAEYRALWSMVARQTQISRNIP